jgi:hypothetical protein
MVTNTNVHTPYSFCNYESIDEIVSVARKEGITALGINDVNTFDGYNEFFTACQAHGVYPFFNIGFVVKYDTDKTRGTHAREYDTPENRHFHGIGLRYPMNLPGDARNLIASIWKGTQDHIWKVIDSINAYLSTRSLPVVLDYSTIRSSFARFSVLEQHLVLALYSELTALAESDDELLTLLRRLFDDPTFTEDLTDAPTIQQGIRDRLLNPGQPVFPPLPAHAVMNFHQAKQVVLQAGGIPCYHCTFNEKEKQPQKLMQYLDSKGIHAIEFDPSGATVEQLSDYMKTFDEQGFCILAGIHNRASFIPATSDGTPLSGALLDISYRGACLLAAHQELHRQNRRGFIDETGKRIIDPDSDHMKAFVDIGDKAIRKASAM